MEQPIGYQNKNEKFKVCKLKKGLYGLKQSSRIWNKKLDSALKRLGLTQNALDPCVYYCKKDDKTLIVTIYVDDFLIFFK